MADTVEANEPLAMADIVGLARLYAEGVVPDEFKQTLPIPAVEDGNNTISVYYSPVKRLQSGDKGAVLFPAEFRVSVSYPDGEFIVLERLGADTQPGEIDPDGSLGLHQVTLSMEEFDGHKQQLFDLYDRLLPIFFQQGDKEGLSGDKERFMSAFRQVYEKPFLHYYRTRGGEFFDWIRADQS